MVFFGIIDSLAIHQYSIYLIHYCNIHLILTYFICVLSSVIISQNVDQNYYYYQVQRRILPVNIKEKAHSRYSFLMEVWRLVTANGMNRNVIAINARTSRLLY